MSDTEAAAHAWRRYDELRRARPTLFSARSGPGVIELLGDPDDVSEAEARAQARAGGVSAAAEAYRAGVWFEDPYVLAVRDPVRFPDGTPGCYLRITTARAGLGLQAGSVVLPVDGASVILLRHYRHALGRVSLEAPRGFGDGGETSEATARRELREELGVEVASLVPLGVVWPDGGLLAFETSLYLAHVPHVGELEVGEGISGAVRLSVAEFERGIAAGSIADSYTLAAFARARVRGEL